jgi:hypothetical protein
MRAAGLRFSTLGTDRYRTAHRLYRQHGYEETGVLAAALAPWETAHQPTRLRAQRPGPEGYDFTDRVFTLAAEDYLGFAWRHLPFTRLRDKVSLEDIWILWKNDQPIGYALARVDRELLNVHDLLMREGFDAAEGVAALAAEIKTSYVRVNFSRPADLVSLHRAGYKTAHPNWGAFMVKPLTPEVTYMDAQRLFGIGTDRFMISWLDVT